MVASESCLRVMYSYTPQFPAMQEIARTNNGYWPVPDASGVFYDPVDVLAHVRETVKAVPGVRAKRDGTWLGASYDVAWLVQGILDAWRVPYAVKAPNVHHPRPYSPEAREEVERLIRATPSVNNWLVRPELCEGVDGRFTLLDYQTAGIWFALERNGGMWEVPPGGGKTVMSSTFLGLDLNPGPALIVTKNAVTTQFARAVKHFLRGVHPFEMPSQSQAPVRGGERVPIEDMLRQYIDLCDYSEATGLYVNGRPIVVVGWDTIRHVDNDLNAIPWSTCIFDESHYGKATRRWETIRKLHGPEREPIESRAMTAWRIGQACPRTLAMTGTPQPNVRRDWWGQLALFSNGWEVGSWDFDTRYCDAKPGKYAWDTDGQSNTDEFLYRKQFLVYTVPQAVVDANLPPMDLSIFSVSPANQDKTDRWFAEERKRLAKKAGRGDLSARSLLRELDLLEAAARKRTAVLALAEDYYTSTEGRPANGKVIYMTGRHVDCWRLAYDTRKRYPGVDVFCGVVAEREGQIDPETGKEYTPAKIARGGFKVLEDQARQDLQDAYMRHPGPCTLVVTEQAWGTGLDLHDTDLMVVVYIPPEPGELDQVLRRVHRLGLKRRCRIVLAVAERTRDERQAAIVAVKTSDILVTTGNETLGRIRELIRGTDPEQMEAILDGIADKLVDEITDIDEIEEMLWAS